MTATTMIHQDLRAVTVVVDLQVQRRVEQLELWWSQAVIQKKQEYVFSTEFILKYKLIIL